MTPEQIVGMIGNIGNRPDMRECQAKQIEEIKKLVQDASWAIQVDLENLLDKYRPKKQTIHVEAQAPIDVEREADLNEMEKSFGDELSESELAAMFNVPVPKKTKKEQKLLSKMSLKEIESMEAAQNNANDIYKVSARIKNLARGAVRANLTAQGDMIVNTFTHVIKGFYDFAETIEDETIRNKLIAVVRKQEEAPANLISALGAGVKLK